MGCDKVFPEMVTEDGKGYKAVPYHELPFLMLQATRELKSEREALEAELETMRAEQASRDAQWEQRIRILEQLLAGKLK
jgi:hypothetical protein